MRPLRILTVVSEGPPIRSGIARTISHLRNGLIARGHTVDLIAYPEVPRLVLGEMRLSGLALRLNELASKVDKYDLLHLHGAAPTVSDFFSAYARASGPRAPLVYTHHCDIEVGRFRFLSDMYNAFHHRLTNQVASEIVGTTRGYAAEMGEDDRTSVIPLGVDLARFSEHAEKASQFTVLFVGQFRPYKGVDVLLRAMAQVHGARLIVAGHGPLERRLRLLAEQLGVSVEFHVNLPDLAIDRLYEEAHVVVLPSVTRAEAFGLVLVEGMAAGCVPVASDLPGVREVLGRIGFTFPRGSAHGLASVLRTLRDQPELTAEIGQRARCRAAGFSWERTVADYERLFYGLLAARELQLRSAASLVNRPAALDDFLNAVAQIMSASHAEAICYDDSRTIRLSSAFKSQGAPEAGQDRQLEAIGRYVRESGESVLVGPGCAPALLQQQLGTVLSGWTAAAPLTHAGRPFGVLAVRRREPFDQRDVGSLSRLAHHASPPLLGWNEVAVSQQRPRKLVAVS